MKVLTFTIFAFFYFSALGQISTINVVDAEQVTVYVLPKNIHLNAKNITYGPPQKDSQGNCFFLQFDNHNNYIVKTEYVPASDSENNKVLEVYLLGDEVSETVQHKLIFNRFHTGRDENSTKIVNLKGTIDGIKEIDLQFASDLKSDLRNMFFQELIKSNGYQVVLNMKQN